MDWAELFARGVLIQYSKKGEIEMSNSQQLSLPTNIPWKLVAVSPDMMDTTLQQTFSIFLAFFLGDFYL